MRAMPISGIDPDMREYERSEGIDLPQNWGMNRQALKLERVH
jgi:hypothetical protein